MSIIDEMYVHAPFDAAKKVEVGRHVCWSSGRNVVYLLVGD
jgi:hypothetical protein